MHCGVAPLASSRSSRRPPVRRTSSWIPAARPRPARSGSGIRVTFDSCTKEQHDAYAVLGPDGKVYPTWHPPTGPGGCSFGHEHGRDPAGSDLYGETDGLPFGVANEMLAISDPANPRDEDHFGHKVEWENDIDLDFQGAGSAIFTVQCDVLTKFHQGTHSKDAFTNNVHELVYHIRCDNGTRMGITMLTADRPAGRVRPLLRPRASTSRRVRRRRRIRPRAAGSASIPDRACIESAMLVAEGQNSNFGALHETWETSNLRARDPTATCWRTSTRTSRCVCRAASTIRRSRPTVGRPIDVCYEVTATGERASGGPCDRSTDDGQTAGVTFDDPRSEFNGADHFVDINANNISNSDGPDVWYTDAYGRNGRTEPFPGSLRQHISSVDNNIGVDVNGPTIGDDRNYGGDGVRAPN